jgi:dTDP-4-amino-4,6-dideoxygalactose transaminase
LLDQMLRESGVPCHLEETMQNELDRAAALLEPMTRDNADTDVTDQLSLRRRRDSLPAILGGEPRFVRPMPFVLPPRPALERVMRRLAPSYDRGILTNGPLVAELEARAAARLGVAHVVAVNSCTSGLMLAVQALVEGRPGPVVLPSFTFSATAHAVAWNGRTPRFVDCTQHGFQIDPSCAAEELGDASALMATHVFGAPCDPVRIAELGRAHGVPVIFDAAHAFGALADGTAVGSFGAVEVFSLTPTKVLVAGEGGLLSTNDEALAQTLRIARDYGNPGNYDTQFAGLNARMSEFHAAMALESLEMLDESLERRRALAERYRNALSGIEGIGFQAVDPRDTSTYKDFTITVDADHFGLTRDGLVRTLKAEGVDTRTYFDPPVHRQRAYRHVDYVCLPVTEHVSGRVLSLPIFPTMRDTQLEQIAEIIAGVSTNAVEIDAFLATSDRADDSVLELG